MAIITVLSNWCLFRIGHVQNCRNMIYECIFHIALLFWKDFCDNIGVKTVGDAFHFIWNQSKPQRTSIKINLHINKIIEKLQQFAYGIVQWVSKIAGMIVCLGICLRYAAMFINHQQKCWYSSLERSRRTTMQQYFHCFFCTAFDVIADPNSQTYLSTFLPQIFVPVFIENMNLLTTTTKTCTCMLMCWTNEIISIIQFNK